MNWNIIDQPIAHEWVRALCLTLMHSLWQGLVAAIGAGIILLCTRKSKPAFRYNLLALVMLLFVVGTVLTFNLMIRDSGEISGSVVVFSKEWGVPTTFQHAGDIALATAETDWIMKIMAFFNANAQVIVAGWFLVFVLKSILAASGLLYLRKVAQQVSTPEMKWIVRFYELAERMRIGQEVELRESAQVAVPLVIGFLKPVVLVPLGMLANLPAAQVEAILLHELAHIRRRDYLINLVQIFCENVFFFNPAVWWISRLIREEREHCCDDLAISVMQNKTSFIHALVSFQEYNQSRPAFEMAFSKKRNHLLDRIKRIVNNNNKSLDAMEKLFVTFSLAAAIALSAATTPEKPVTAGKAPAVKEVRLNEVKPLLGEVKAVPSPKAQNSFIQEPDTLPKKKLRSEGMEIHSANVYMPQQGISTYNVTRNNKQYEIVKRNGKIISLFVDDQEIAAENYAKYQPEIDKIMVEVKAQHELAEKQREEAQEMRKIAEEQRRVAEKQREEAQVMRLEAEKQREHASQMRLDAKKHQEYADQMRVNANANHDQLAKVRGEAEKMREAAEDMRKQAELMRREAEKQREHADEQRVQAEGQRKQAEEMRREAEKQREVYMKRQEAVIEELTGAGLVKDKDELSFKLSDDELIVNGEKQSADLHQKLKAKYLNDGGDKKSTMYYNYNGRSGYSTRAR
ncbi:beta-lactamase regulating signal transducer with metallopeptidase domain [Dyadobacter sp. BE34]|uniref:Beta-lactamase regulating signal transducer with metallopeptidase domain n=1 Tax=Dyadobacter fermentans TaxID=94254 RepID=A0ABU1QYN7_9BACT|nr:MULTISPECIES: M56 family metallopeptidase [Dyadobacter]MDR6806269.1 beta-lactamase regulating signal transducer with metallopeptidase domain [Dyadobacter fermentans]MDR7044010.1 beta-lactamase regulating signal transducer with metallopeptidase domain [Dyadobacter sp. BE242]MDR7198321.1 beta-lactamase regulating signal transducer with metallopeptidase domain [Dyadobacter sp. BE34]MDR7216283.1 beta-lactamase regulating signal transducer with metallopeptidase domain [Dyadobacter sp. BE31]MDR72